MRAVLPWLTFGVWITVLAVILSPLGERRSEMRAAVMFELWLMVGLLLVAAGHYHLLGRLGILS